MNNDVSRVIKVPVGGTREYRIVAPDDSPPSTGSSVERRFRSAVVL
jgi:hypothetical protein